MTSSFKKYAEVMGALLSLACLVLVLLFTRVFCGEWINHGRIDHYKVYNGTATITFDTRYGKVVVQNQRTEELVFEAVVWQQQRVRSIGADIKPNQTWSRSLFFDRVQSFKVCKIDRSEKRIWDCYSLPRN